METITLKTGRVVGIGLRPTLPGVMLAAAPMPSAPAPDRCINSNGTKWELDGNDQYGDCVTVYLANWLEMVTGCEIPRANVFAWAQSHGWMNGANIKEAIDALGSDPMIDTEGKGHTVGPGFGVNYANLDNVRSAIYTYKGLDLGVDAGPLQQVVGDKNGWVLSGLRRNYQNINHSVGYLDYGPAGYLADYLAKTYQAPVALGDLSPEAPAAILGTWGTLGIVELDSGTRITGEAWAVTPPAPGPEPVPTPVPTPTPSPFCPCPNWRRAVRPLIELGKLLMENQK